MIIKNLTERKDGSVNFDFSCDKPETQFLLSFAIKTLMREGIIKTTADELYQEVDLPLETKH
jgi:hypothetical protein